MTMSTAPESPAPFEAGQPCSTWARELGLDPIGTAGCYRGYLLVEWALPWPRDLGEDEVLAPVVESTRSHGMRFQALVPTSESGPRHVVAYRWPASGGARFWRTELAVEPGELAAACLAVLDVPAAESGGTDVLVCTHGRRDRCCGSLGTALAQELLGDARPLGQDVRVWRTSHTGGHRFAPTAVVLPQGTAWAFCDAATLARIVRGDGLMDDLLPRYRGCAGLVSPAVQALERAVLAVVGWPLFEMARQGSELGDDRTELVVEDPTAGRVVWEAVVRVAGTIQLPGCGLAREAATKPEPQLVVEGLRLRR